MSEPIKWTTQNKSTMKGYNKNKQSNNFNLNVCLLPIWVVRPINNFNNSKSRAADLDTFHPRHKNNKIRATPAKPSVGSCVECVRQNIPKQTLRRVFINNQMYTWLADMHVSIAGLARRVINYTIILYRLLTTSVYFRSFLRSKILLTTYWYIKKHTYILYINVTT